METSRIFVRGLPPSLTEADFRNHFSSQLPTTDVKFFPQRRIGYVGYKSPADAARAVKYFNKTFMRMSRIHVEAARPIAETPLRSRTEDRERNFETQGASTEIAGSPPKKRKREAVVATDNEKLQEYLEVMEKPSKSTLTTKERVGAADLAQTELPVANAGHAVDEESEQEYQEVRKKQKRMGKENVVRGPNSTAREEPETVAGPSTAEDLVDVSIAPCAEQVAANNGSLSSDSDWLRSRTSRLLDLDDEVEVADQSVRHTTRSAHAEQTVSEDDTGLLQVPPNATPAEDQTNEQDRDIRDQLSSEPLPSMSSRLFVRNLPYDVTEEALEAEFQQFGHVAELHIPIDKKTGGGKGFAYVLYSEPEDATRAMQSLDGNVFQGRLLHILPAANKRDKALDDFAISQLPLKKQQQIKRKAQASSSTFNWNSLYMSTDAVLSSVADRLGISKSDFLDPTSSDASIKQAHAETHVISETKAFFAKKGIDVEAFRKHAKGDTGILVKNFPYGTTKGELRKLFEQYGSLTRLLIPPTGTIAIVQYAQAPEARAAFAALAYRKFKDALLYLEKAPRDLFRAETSVDDEEHGPIPAAKDAKLSANDLLASEPPSQVGNTATVFVKNLNFKTTTQQLRDAFKTLAGFVTATVKTKHDFKNPDHKSMGFGFLEFKSKEEANAAVASLNGYSLDGHKLELKLSHRGADAAAERRADDSAKRAANKGTKIIIKNLPFESSKKDVRALFGAYGQLRSVRVPKKFDNSARGFAFAEFTTPREAQNAMDALRNTHVLGRRLVLEFTAQETEDAEEELERMQKKVGSQINKVALQKLTGAGRQKFNAAGDDLEE